MLQVGRGAERKRHDSLFSPTNAQNQAISRWHVHFCNKGKASRHANGIFGARCGYSRWYSEQFWRSAVIPLDLLFPLRLVNDVSLFIDIITKLGNVYKRAQCALSDSIGLAGGDRWVSGPSHSDNASVLKENIATP